MEIKRRADTEKEGGVELLPVLGHEGFLFGSAEADPKEVGFEGLDLANQVLLLGGGERAKGGSAGADDPDSRESLFEAALQFPGNAGRAAVQEVREGAGLSEFTDAQHEVGAVNTVHVAESLPAAHPDGRHPIGGGEKRVVENGTEGRILLGFTDAVNAGHTNIALGFFFERTRDGGDGQVQIQGADADAEDVRATGFHLFFRPVQ